MRESNLSFTFAGLYSKNGVAEYKLGSQGTYLSAGAANSYARNLVLEEQTIAPRQGNAKITAGTIRCVKE